MNPAQRRTLRLYQAFQFFFTMLFWLPVFYEYQKRLGLTDPQIFGIQSLYYTAFCFLEIPTGMLADQVGYRRSMRFGAVVMLGANLAPILEPTYAGFLAHFMLIALARSCISGASSAYLYRFLEEQGVAPQYKDIEGAARSYALLGKVAGWSVVGALMQWQMTAPYWLTVASLAVAVVVAWRLPEVTPPPLLAEEARLWPRLKKSLGMVLTSPRLSLGVAQGVCVFVLVRICQLNLFQPILGAKDVPLAWYGAVMSLTTLFEAFGSARPGIARRYLDDSSAVLVYSALMALVLVYVPRVSMVGVLILLPVFSFFGGLTFPLQRQVLNDAIPDSRYRATILSVESIVDRAANAAVAGMVGGYLARGELDLFLRGTAAVTVTAMVVIYGLRRRFDPA